MTKSEIKKVEEVMDTLRELEKLLEERIVDFYDVKGMQQARHAYCFYRKYVWEAKYALRDMVDESEEKISPI